MISFFFFLKKPENKSRLKGEHSHGTVELATVCLIILRSRCVILAVHSLPLMTGLGCCLFASLKQSWATDNKHPCGPSKFSLPLSPKSLTGLINALNFLLFGVHKVSSYADCV
ncbi:hypothetical protein K469DRAFT_108259 [Zopfia rhizophila CBS 207.26]|uniref:Uncharacterized protein n=1 Tax=Zopfia rhizophila CBS 207.26 TaxID=1314779 RepID=A0A6A6E9W0_9PEZI|nr:hypothetical protein K469DRAFT_108259 [Zopfia rhizophila CBS 207.26]